MSIKQTDDGQWLVDVRPQGRTGKRIRKKFDKKTEAQQYERWVIATQNNKDWIDKPTDRRKLSECIELWWKYYGINLGAGRSNLLKLEKLDQALGQPTANQINAMLLAEYRSKRLASGISQATITREFNLLSGVFTELISLGYYHNEHPLKKIKIIKPKSPAMIFLTLAEINQLLAELTGDNLKIVRFCLATGARWGEAKYLRQQDVINNKATFVKTKNSKHRTIPISTALYDEIKSDQSTIFNDIDYIAIRLLIKEVAPHIPKGQAVHVLRHTFASHFIMSGGNILALQKILGHSTITQTMVYAHLAPDYLIDAIRFNPISQLEVSTSCPISTG